MSDGRDVTLTIKVNGKELDTAEASTRRLNKAMNDVGKETVQALGVSDAAIKKHAAELQQALSKSQGSFEDTIRSYKKELTDLANNVKSGSVNNEDFARRMKLLPASLQEATSAASAMGRGLGEVEKSGKSFGEGLEMLRVHALGARYSIGSLGTILESAGPYGIAVIAATALTVGLVYAFTKVAEEVFSLSKGFADYVNGISTVSQETGLSTETVSALTAELKTQGKSFNDVKPSVASFTKLLAEAAAGIEDAKKKVISLGLDPKTAINNLDQSFRQAVATVAKIQDPFKQALAASAAFGDNWQKFLPVIREYNGNIDATVDSLRGLGKVSIEDAAQEIIFQRHYAELEITLDHLKNFFGEEFLPKVTHVIEDFGGWLVRNKDEIKGWADWTATWVQTAIDRWTAFFHLLGQVKDAWSGVEPHQAPNFSGVTANRFDLNQGRTATPTQPQPTPQTQSQAQVVQTQEEIDAQTQAARNSIDSSMEYLRAAIAKAEEERKQHQKDELDAQIQLYQMQITRLEQAFDAGFKEITDRFKETGNVAEYQNAFTGLQKMLHDVGGKLTADWQKAVNDRVGLENKGAKQIELIQAQTQEKINALSQKNLDASNQAGKVVQEVQKKSAEAQLNDYKSMLDHKNSLDAASTQAGLAAAKLRFDQGEVTEKNYLDFVEAAERGDLQLKIDRATDWLSHVHGNKQKEAEAENQLDILKAQLAEHDAKRDDAALLRKQKLQQQYDDLKQSLQDEINELVTGKPLSEYEKMVRSVDKAYKDLAPDQKNDLKNLAAQKDAIIEQKKAVEALKEEYEKVKDTIKTMLDYVLRGDFKGLGRSLLDSVRNSISEKLSGVLATIVTGYDPNATNNPVAKPIVKEITGTNKRLDQVIKLLGGTAGAGSLGGLNLGSIFGGSAGGGIFNFGGSGGASTGSHEILHSNAAGGGSILDRLRGIFSTDDGGDGEGGQGGIFQRRGGSRAAGIIGGIGDLAAVAGGLIGGRVGNIISAVGTGASIGASVGGLPGAIIGAGIGLIVGLLGGDPKRKKDKNENIPALQKGFADSMAQLNKILDDLRHLNIDPDDAINQAIGIRADIAGGYGIQFQSKKYKKQAQQMIAQELTQADSIIGQIRGAAEIARGAADRSKRILPEFAGGAYFADFFRPNGLMPGAFDGRDNIFAMISRGEMVLNPYQQSNVRALAGFDVFAGAGIPNYPKESRSAKLATGGIAGAGLTVASPSVVVQPQFTLELTGVSIDDKVNAYLTSDKGIRTQIKVNKTLKTRGDL